MRLATPAFGERQPVTDGERRRRPRHTATGGVTLLTSGLGEGPTRQRISSIELQDVSPTGAGALSENRLDPGSRVALFFPPHGPDRGFDLYGEVVRCQRDGARYVLGIELERNTAA
jgi:hypothetical protein